MGEEYEKVMPGSCLLVICPPLVNLAKWVSLCQLNYQTLSYGIYGREGQEIESKTRILIQFLLYDAGEVVESDRMAGINFSLHTQLYKKCYIELVSIATVTN